MPITVIADGTTIDGRVQVADDLRVDGTVDGPLLHAGATCEVSAAGTVTVETARAATLLVHGTLRAREVHAQRVVVSATGTLHAGVLAADALEVEAGGTLDAELELGATP